jgi:predicted metal-binding membrane protein
MTALRARWPATPIQRGQLLLIVVLALLTAGAWALTLHQARTMDMSMGVIARGGVDLTRESPPADVDSSGMADMGDVDDMASMPGMAAKTTEGSSQQDASQLVNSGMAGMVSNSWTWDGLTTFVIAWGVMMAAMMFPAAAPMLLLYRTVAQGRRARGGAFVPTWVFAGGYLLVWIGAGVATWVLVQIGSDVASRLIEADRNRWAPVALGAVLIVAGLYQFTALKGMCLRQCQSPVGFVMTHWRDGYRGALQMGFVHGLFCLGCCWALFAVLVAAGVMSVAWMLLLTLVVFLEKVVPRVEWGSRAVGFGLLALGFIVLAGAIEMPWVA